MGISKSDSFWINSPPLLVLWTIKFIILEPRMNKQILVLGRVQEETMLAGRYNKNATVFKRRQTRLGCRNDVWVTERPLDRRAYRPSTSWGSTPSRGRRPHTEMYSAIARKSISRSISVLELSLPSFQCPKLRFAAVFLISLDTMNILFELYSLQLPFVSPDTKEIWFQ